MSNRVWDAIIHGTNVAGHIVFSVLLTGLGVLLADPKVIGAFAGYVGRFGIPVAIVNVVVAAILRYIDTKPTITDTIDSLPDVTSQA